MLPAWKKKHIVEWGVCRMDIGDPEHGRLCGGTIAQNYVSALAGDAVARKNDSHLICSGQIIAATVVPWYNLKPNHRILDVVPQFCENFVHLFVSLSVGV
jgi:hypothetical protein